MTETQVQSKDVEEVENEEDFRNDKVFVYLSKLDTLRDVWSEIPRATPIQIGAS